MTDLTAMPLHVRRAAKVCACGHLETEHNLMPTGRRTGCSHAMRCECGGWTYTVDRYAVSTYVDVLAGEAAPQMALVLPDELAAIVRKMRREADTGAPGGMVAVYVELALRHLMAAHGGAWQDCMPCHDALGGNW